MSDKAVNFVRAGISGVVGICCIAAKILGSTEANWPYAAALICLVVTVGYLKQALDK